MANEAEIHVKHDDPLHKIMGMLESDAEQVTALEVRVAENTTALATEKADILRQLKEEQDKIVALQTWARAWDEKLPAGSKIWMPMDGAKPEDESRREIGLFLKELINYRRHKTDGKAKFGSQLWERSQVIGVNANGGFLVYPEHSNIISTIVGRYGLARRFLMQVDMRDTKSNTMQFPVGVNEPVVTWPAAELTAPPDTTLTLARPTLTIKTAVATDTMSIESIEDTTPSIMQYVTDRMFIAFAREEDFQAFAAKGPDGGGTEPFDGLLYANGVQVYTMQGGATNFNQLTYDDLVKVQDIVSEFTVDDSRYIYSNSIHINVRLLKDTTGRPLIMFDGMTERTPDRLMGFPVNRSAVMPKQSATAISTPFVLFGDMTGAAMAVRNDFRVDVSEHVKFPELGLMLRCYERIGFKLIQGAKIGRIRTAAA